MKPYLPKFTIEIQREFDGKVEGKRSWVLVACGRDIDKLEDAVSFLANAAMDYLTVGKSSTLTKGE